MFNKDYTAWWDKSGEFKLLHQINPLRVKYISNKIKEHFNTVNNNSILLNSLTLIDIGCGGGLICSEMNKLITKITGLDIHLNNIKAAMQYNEEHKLNVNYIHSTLEEHVLLNKKYNIVLCLEVIEHVKDPKSFIYHLSQLLEPNGIMIISTINRTIKAYFSTILLAEYILNWIPKSTHYYYKFIKPSELYTMISPYNLTLIELKGLSFNILSQSWVLSKNIDINYFACIKKI